MSLEALVPILLIALVASGSPGPATLAIAGTSMGAGRRHGLALAAGVVLGSWTWSLAAALGLGAVMAAHGWIFEIMRYVAAGYLLWLGLKAARRAWAGAKASPIAQAAGTSLRGAFAKGLALHLTNPKAILFFGSLYSIALPANAPWRDFAIIGGSVGVLSLMVFLGYALLFSRPPIVRAYTRLGRWFDAAFALLFGAAALRILTARIS
ncbi:LysE family translocator [Rhodophyticola porphyridii]|uniref:LysE family translocator n=1 Tax=Rhodophyticola porphyridii TaxID=1852017 RepID=A0A3L9XW87_9RHOB|nr:LysE family transporter [Rhodophyticola porphyridii]RMA40789.1 LysE family translocator [Rhodophyticola porphyridii]